MLGLLWFAASILGNVQSSLRLLKKKNKTKQNKTKKQLNEMADFSPCSCYIQFVYPLTRQFWNCNTKMLFILKEIL